MAQLITIRNANRTPLRIGSVNIPRNGDAVTVDLDDGRVRRDLYRHVGRWIVVSDNPDTSPIPPNEIDSIDPLGAAGSIADAAGDPPTDVEFNALVADHNSLQVDVAMLADILGQMYSALQDHNILD